MAFQLPQQQKPKSYVWMGAQAQNQAQVPAPKAAPMQAASPPPAAKVPLQQPTTPQSPQKTGTSNEYGDYGAKRGQIGGGTGAIQLPAGSQTTQPEAGQMQPVPPKPPAVPPPAAEDKSSTPASAPRVAGSAPNDPSDKNSAAGMKYQGQIFQTGGEALGGAAGAFSNQVGQGFKDFAGDPEGLKAATKAKQTEKDAANGPIDYQKRFDDEWADIQKQHDAGLQGQLDSTYADESLAGRRMAEMNALGGGGSGGGAFAGGAAQVALGGMQQRLDVRNQHNKQGLEMKMAVLGRYMEQAERDKDRNLQAWLQDQSDKTALQIAGMSYDQANADTAALLDQNQTEDAPVDGSVWDKDYWDKTGYGRSLESIFTADYIPDDWF